MGKEYTAKSFKSGNSVAIRIPAGLGVEPDDEWTVVEDNGKLVLSRKPKARRKFDVDAIWGIGKGLDLQPIKPEDRAFEHRKLIWEDPDWPGWAASDT